MSNIDQTPVNAGAEVTVEPQNTQGAAQTADVATGTPEGKQSQSKEENATFAAMRRQYEQQLTERDTRLAGLDALAKKAGHESVERMLLAQRATEMGLSIEEMEKYHALLYVAEFCESLALIDSRDAFVLKNIL